MKDITEIRDFFAESEQYRGAVFLNEPIAPKTTFKIGGTAPLFFEPEDADSLLFALRFLKKNGISFFILGGGSNIVVSDNGFDGAVLSTARLNSLVVRPDSASGTEVTCGAGTATARLVSFCTEKRLSGLEKFAGLPGSVGGALFMNARCFETSISGLLKRAACIDCDTLQKTEYLFRDEDWAYKCSPFQDGKKILTEATFSLAQCSEHTAEKIAADCKHYINERIKKGHFKFPSAGSVFKNNRDFGEPSGKIIDGCGLCGMRIGGAQIAPWHGNFIINIGNATQKDVKGLVDFVVNKVQAERGFSLQTEIIFCGKE